MPEHDVGSSEVLQMYKQRFGFPSTYLVLDTETTGFSHERDFFVDLGWALVENDQVVHKENMLLDWSKVNVDHQWIQSQLWKQAEFYAKTGKTHAYPWERLCDEGVNPLEAIYKYSQLIFDHIVRGDSAIVGHGLWKFDRNMINSHTHRFLDGYQLPWQSNSIIDTGLLEKAIQTKQFPWPGDTLDEWLTRVSNAFAKAKWNLGEHCNQKYGLVKTGEAITDLHTASYDCVLTQRLIEVYKQLTR